MHRLLFAENRWRHKQRTAIKKWNIRLYLNQNCLNCTDTLFSVRSTHTIFHFVKRYHPHSSFTYLIFHPECVLRNDCNAHIFHAFRDSNAKSIRMSAFHIILWMIWSLGAHFCLSIHYTYSKYMYNNAVFTLIDEHIEILEIKWFWKLTKCIRHKHRQTHTHTHTPARAHKLNWMASHRRW